VKRSAQTYQNGDGGTCHLKALSCVERAGCCGAANEKRWAANPGGGHPMTERDAKIHKTNVKRASANRHLLYKLKTRLENNPFTRSSKSKKNISL
jgi:hypothetical protein